MDLLILYDQLLDIKSLSHRGHNKKFQHIATYHLECVYALRFSYYPRVIPMKECFPTILIIIDNNYYSLYYTHPHEVVQLQAKKINISLNHKENNRKE